MYENSVAHSSAGDAAVDRSVTHRAYVEMRAALISCQLPPGSRLNISQLQRDLGVSQAAVREGLSRLAAEELVTIERNSGFRAAPVSAEGYRELANACLTIELTLLDSSVKNGDYAWEGALLSSYHIASRILSEACDVPASMNSYVQHREQFHRTLFSCCDNKWLLWSWSLLYAQQLRYRQTFLQLAMFERGLHEDYRKFIDAIIERNVVKAATLWSETHHKVVDFIESNLEAPLPGKDGAAPRRRRRRTT
jgi:DNA-binding GntR family transcriptional regulator